MTMVDGQHIVIYSPLHTIAALPFHAFWLRHAQTDIRGEFFLSYIEHYILNDLEISNVN